MVRPDSYPSTHIRPHFTHAATVERRFRCQSVYVMTGKVLQGAYSSDSFNQQRYDQRETGNSSLFGEKMDAELPESRYYVQEPRVKRAHQDDEQDMEYAPRAKRRFDKISARLENFSISNDRVTPLQTFDSSSDDEMEEILPEESNNIASSSVEECVEPLILEPEEDEPPKKLRLDERLQMYLEMARNNHLDFIPKSAKTRGDELVVWRAPVTINPFDDPTMSGRIRELTEEEEQDVFEEMKHRQLLFDGMTSEEPSDNGNCIVDCDASSVASSTEGSFVDLDSPLPSPPNIVEVTEERRDLSSPTSLTNGSVSDEEMMDFD
ncbi:unnamed protein product [Caenorhabditis auriculariae]|uniref:Uncharacterized protein n=1 Tax=Caenorhabditis auriculariae TaxID=2777116 RepID=A0A8S1GQ00_9PELO|nr:unnamed protein product [Caenorhabditis auriculariae]